MRREFESTALPYLSDLYAIAMRLTRNPDDARDLVQETFLRGYQAWGSFQPGSNCRAWMIRILTNSFINHYRRGRSVKAFTRRGEDEQVRALYGLPAHERTENRGAESQIVDEQLGDEVAAALGELPPDYRVVVVLADLEEMKYKDIAEALGCPIGTVMSRLFRARRQLEERLSGYAAKDYGIRRQSTMAVLRVAG